MLRLINWLFWRIVWISNVIRATSRWAWNYLNFFLWKTFKWIYWRGVGAYNYVKAGARWISNHVQWLIQASSYRMHFVTNLVLRSWNFVRVHFPFGSYKVSPRPDINLGPLKTMTGKEIIVVIHAHHMEILPEIFSALSSWMSALGQSFEIIMTLTNRRMKEVERLAERYNLEVQIIPVRNLGRDVLPFLELLRSGKLTQALLILKIHTKLSPHRSDGPSWRNDLVAGLTQPELLDVLTSRALAGEEFIVAPSAYISGAKDWGRNINQTLELARSLGINSPPFRFRFPAGTMFWITSGLAERLAHLPLSAEHFEPEPLPLDGAKPHAVERMAGIIATKLGSGLYSVEELVGSNNKTRSK